jgi:hypothetical protein
MRVSETGPDGPITIFQRKLVPELEYEAGDVAFLFRTMRVAGGNLNGAGAYGSRVDAGVAVR